MDQLKTFLGAVKQHHFWILCGLASIVGLAMFFGADKRLTGSYVAQKGKISSADDSLKPFTSGTDHPNQKWADGVKVKADESRNKVFKAWNQLYQQQKQQVFIWPQDLGKEFIDAFADNPAKVGPVKMTEFCEIYQNYITSTTLPAMAKIIEAQWVDQGGADPAGRSRFPGARPPAPRERGANANDADTADSYKVTWDQSDQQRMASAYNWQKAPSETDVRLAQEEMWVLKAIFESIKRANAGATGSFDTVVRQVDWALIGYDASNRFPLGEGENRGIRSQAASFAASTASQGAEGAPAAVAFDPKRPIRSGSGGGADAFDSGGRSGRRGGAPPAADAPGAAQDPDVALLNGRYVDAKGKPLMATESQASTNPEYNLMAFKLRLVVDEGRFEKVIAELANSTLPLEVRGVRINAGAEAANAGPQMRDRGGRGGGGRLGGGARAPAMAQPAGENAVHSVTLDIYGMAYLINPPDPKKLNLPDATDSPVATPAAAGTPSTGATPAAAATPATAPAGASESPPIALPMPTGGATTSGAVPTDPTGGTAPTPPAKGAAGTTDAATPPSK